MVTKKTIHIETFDAIWIGKFSTAPAEAKQWNNDNGPTKATILLKEEAHNPVTMCLNRSIRLLIFPS